MSGELEVSLDDLRLTDEQAQLLRSSQVEAARLLIKMLAKDGEPITDDLWSVAGALPGAES